MFLAASIFYITYSTLVLVLPMSTVLSAVG